MSNNEASLREKVILFFDKQVIESGMRKEWQALGQILESATGKSMEEMLNYVLADVETWPKLPPMESCLNRIGVQRGIYDKSIELFYQAGPTNMLEISVEPYFADKRCGKTSADATNQSIASRPDYWEVKALFRANEKSIDRRYTVGAFSDLDDAEEFKQVLAQIVENARNRLLTNGRRNTEK